MMLLKFERVRCSGSNIYIRSMRVPQLPFFFEVQPVTLVRSLDKHTEEAEEKLQVLLGGSSENGLMVKSRASWPTFR